MAMWKYTIDSGKALREAIEDGSTIETVECLKVCCQELMDKLGAIDRHYCAEDIQDIIDTIDDADMYDIDEIDDCLRDFYDLCDGIRAFVSL